MATIKAIDGGSVHQIQSGQVIVDLQSVCKELVENSIDAGATSIEVRFKTSGLDAIEVQDNGAGIAPADYDTIALKHYTSKLSTYDDLASLQTFGFRGEALSSLCALSHFHVITARPSDGPKGAKLEFEQSGKLKGTSVVAAKQGTTAVVETLFYNLPVRRKELEKNIKREYNKVLHLLNAYACISVGVKFIVSNQPAKGKKTLAFSTNANTSTRDNISNVYGAKTIAALIPLDLKFEMEPSYRPGVTQSTGDDAESRTVKIIGHISRPVVGEGRQTPDRQMFFVNSRPCNLPQVAKAFNEAYKSYNITQSPFIFADLRLDTNAYDVNVSPDKRSIMLHDQTALLESLKGSLLQLFESHDQSVPSAQLLGNRTVTSAFKAPSLQPRATTGSSTREEDDRGDIVHSRQRKEPPSIDNSHNKSQPGFIKASLFEQYTGQDVEDRANTHAPQRKRKASPACAKGTSGDASTAHVSGYQRRHSSNSSGPRSPPCQRSPSPLFELGTHRSPLTVRSGQMSKAVEDFNARMAAQRPRTTSRQQIDDNDNEDMEQLEEEPIPALDQKLQKPLTQNVVQNAFDRMRPMRTPTQQASITVGNTTTVSIIGSGSQPWLSKKARIHTPKFSLSGTPLSQTPKKQLSFKSLRGFAAPGTQAETSDENEDEDEDAQNTTMLESSEPSSSSDKQFPPRPFVEPRIDDLVESSSALPPPTETVDDAEDIEIEPNEEEEFDDEYIGESEKKAMEEAKIERMIIEAEEAATRPTESNLKRANKIFKVSQSKYQTVYLETTIETSAAQISQHLHSLTELLDATTSHFGNTDIPPTIQLKEDPEERLNLTVSKADFHSMRIIGQFNLGFIIALRPPTPTSPTPDLFIIDQHASDEKYNFERLSASTTLVAQRLVHPHPLELTAVEEELIRANTHALSANGFTIDLNANHTSHDTITYSRPRRSLLTALPMSKEATFTPKDLEELLALLHETPSSLLPESSPSPSSLSSPTQSRRASAKKQAYIPRPTKVRALLASRACRSSVMIGKTLSQQQMGRIVRHMGGMDKPWSCPHGRPTMRHLFALDRWEGWREWGSAGEGEGQEVDWGAFVSGRKG